MKMSPPSHYFYTIKPDNSIFNYSIPYNWVDTEDDPGEIEILRRIITKLKDRALSTQDVFDLLFQIQSLSVNLSENNNLFLDTQEFITELESLKGGKKAKAISERIVIKQVIESLEKYIAED